MKLDWIISDAMAPCFADQMDENVLTAVVNKIAEALTEDEITLLNKALGRSVNLAWYDGHNC
jgi:prepilin-type processing-associated H-X9-DG protein